MNLSWLKDIEPSLKSVSYVLLEQQKNQWHNNGGRDYCIKFEVEADHNQSTNKNLPFGKIGDVVKEIIDCEVNYVSASKQSYLEFTLSCLSQRKPCLSN